ncbi:MAG: translation initiation factor IF-2 N-terminal domain-containing protein, partial [Pyrinomonadaceae bacterium]
MSSSKVRLYDLAKELKLDTKRLIEEVRREGVDVSVPSNSVSKELADKIRNKYFPKKETAVKRTIKVVKRAAHPTDTEETAPHVDEHEEVTTSHAPLAEARESEPSQAPQTAAAPTAQAPSPKTITTARLVKKPLAPATRAEQPATAQAEEAQTIAPPMETLISEDAQSPVELEPTSGATEVTVSIATPPSAETQESAPVEEAPRRTTTPAPAPAVPSSQIRVLRPTAAAL